jgi:hypothetical protein
MIAQSVYGLGYGLDNQGLILGMGNERIFPLHHCIQFCSRAHTASYPMDTRTLSLGLKWLGHEADYSPPSNIGVKNAWRYTSSPCTS